MIPSTDVRKYKQILEGYDILFVAYCIGATYGSALQGKWPGAIKEDAEYFPPPHRMAVGNL